MLIKSKAFAIRGMLCMLCLATSLVHADLMINPTRLVLDERTKSGQLELLNNSTEEVTYRISLVNRRMNEEGKFSAIDKQSDDFKPEPGEHFADDMLKFSPLQVTLEPGKSQIVRIVWRKPESLDDGEYRSHILFSQVASSNSSSSIETTQKGSDGKDITIKLTPLIGATIPIIVRQGALGVETKLTNLVFTPPKNEQGPLLKLVIERAKETPKQGEPQKAERSAYGDLIVSFIPCHSEDKTILSACVEKFKNNPDAPERIELGRMNGLAVYTPNALRRVTIALKPPSTLNLSQGTLIAQFTAPVEEDAKFTESVKKGAKILSSEILALP